MVYGDTGTASTSSDRELHSASKTSALPARPGNEIASLPLKPTGALHIASVPSSLPPKPTRAVIHATVQGLQGMRSEGHAKQSDVSPSPSPQGTSKSGAKRKVEESDGPNAATVDTNRPASSQDSVIAPRLGQSDREPIPILPTPLPSKRFRKNPLKRATFFPIEQIPTYPLPPLPPIDNPALLKQVFTHTSLFKTVKGKFEDPEDDQPKHYEKLEHVGDSLLGMIVTTWLHESKPGLTPGTATQLKAHLVSNATLSHLSALYNMPQRLNADPNLLPVLRASTDVRAALVEAYIAAVYVSHPVEDRFTIALPIIDAWLRDMYDPLFDFFYTYMKREHDQHSNAVGADDDGNVIVMDEDEIARIDDLARGMFLLVQMHCDAVAREFRWEEDRYETSIGTLYRMRIMVDGMELGEATRAGKQQAKDVASWEAAKKLGLADNCSPYPSDHL